MFLTRFKTPLPEMYMTHEDGTYFKEEGEELKLSLILYVDDTELANPLGTARKIHTLCAVYWLLASVPSKYRPSLHVIQLALLCNQSVLSPLLKDLRTPEQDGIFNETVGQCVSGELYYVLQLIIWLPMVLQALCSVSKHGMSADSVAVLQTRYSLVRFLKLRLT